MGAEQDNGSEGTRNPKPTTIHPMGTLTAAIVKKKEMTDNVSCQGEKGRIRRIRR